MVVVGGPVAGAPARWDRLWAAGIHPQPTPAQRRINGRPSGVGRVARVWGARDPPSAPQHSVPCPPRVSRMHGRVRQAQMCLSDPRPGPGRPRTGPAGVRGTHPVESREGQSRRGPSRAAPWAMTVGPSPGVLPVGGPGQTRPARAACGAPWAMAVGPSPGVQPEATGHHVEAIVVSVGIGAHDSGVAGPTTRERSHDGQTAITWGARAPDPRSALTGPRTWSAGRTG